MLSEVFAQILRKLRIEKNLSQEKLAELCDLDRTYISLLERALRQPSLSTFFKLSKALNISPSEFIKLIENEIKF